MHRRLFLALIALPTFACTQSATTASSIAAMPARGKEPLVEFEMMTWPEVKAAHGERQDDGALLYGGTEQRGPQNVNGGHTLMARATVKAIALKLGNAIAMPVLPYTPNNASAQLPGHDRPHA